MTRQPRQPRQTRQPRPLPHARSLVLPSRSVLPIADAGVIAAFAAGLLLLALIVATGCSAKPKDMPELGVVTGTVTLDGKPLDKVTVVFESESGRSSFGSTDATGRYELIYAGNAKGAVVGPNKVVINSQLDAPPGPDWKDPVPARYNAKSELKADVVAGKNTFDFPLESK